MHIQEVLEFEVTALAGARHACGDGASGMRHGSNPGRLRVAGQRVPLRVPRVRGPQGEIPLRSYATVNGSGEVGPVLLKRVLYRISCRNYEGAAAAISEAIKRSSSSVSRASVEASAARVREFQERALRQGRRVEELVVEAVAGLQPRYWTSNRGGGG